MADKGRGPAEDGSYLDRKARRERIVRPASPWPAASPHHEPAPPPPLTGAFGPDAPPPPDALPPPPGRRWPGFGRAIVGPAPPAPPGLPTAEVDPPYFSPSAADPFATYRGPSAPGGAVDPYRQYGLYGLRRTPRVAGEGSRSGCVAQLVFLVVGFFVVSALFSTTAAGPLPLFFWVFPVLVLVRVVSRLTRDWHR